MSILTFISTIFKPAADLIDNLHTSREEKDILRNELAAIEAGVEEKIIELQKSTIDGQAKIIATEAKSDSWLTKSWRPIVVLGLFGLVVLDYFGVSGAKNLPPEAWTTIQVALGGYIGGRSFEKVVDKLVISKK